MPINNWWESDDSERYWMEITDRQDLGADLKAPQRDSRNKETWSYTLVSYAQPGDVVFHWHKHFAGEPALVGWSEVVGPLLEKPITWQAKGAAGRARRAPITGPGWLVPLRNYTKFATPLTRTALQDRRQEILDILADLERRAGGPVYAPFQNYGGKELRAQQGYLAKFPAALVPVLLGITHERPDFPMPHKGPTPVRPNSGQGYISDAARRAAIEQYAVKLARDHYTRLGADQIEELGKPYDLRVILNDEVRHVEVKGATGIGVDSVHLTQGEVDHACAYQPTDLFVVEQIKASQTADGGVSTAGGEVRVWMNWRPQESALRPTHLRYKLPGG